MKIREILARAADDMSTYGKTEGSFYAHHDNWQTSPACAYGSICRVTGVTKNGIVDYDTQSYGDVHAAAAKLAETIHRLRPDNPTVEALRKRAEGYRDAGVDVDAVQVWDTITNYNDATDKEDMVLLLKEAANS